MDDILDFPALPSLALPPIGKRPVAPIETLAKRLGRTTLSGLEAAANVLDTPGSVVRGVLAGDPRRAVSGIFSPSERVTGKELVGIKDNPDSWWDDIGGFGVEVVTDPLTFLTAGAGALTKSGKAAQKAGKFIPPPTATGLGKTWSADDLARMAKSQGKLAPTRESRLLADQGALFGYDIPFGPKGAIGGTGDTSRAIARSVDKLGAAAKASLPGRMVGAMFDPHALNSWDESVQRAGREAVAPLRHEESSAAMRMTREVMDAMGDKLNDEAAKRAFVDAVELGRDSGIPEVEKAAKIWRNFGKTARGRELDAGIPTGLAQRVGFLPRKMMPLDEGTKTFWSKMSQSPLPTVGRENIHRTEAFTGLARSEVDELAMNPMVSGPNRTLANKVEGETFLRNNYLKFYEEEAIAALEQAKAMAAARKATIKGTKGDARAAAIKDYKDAVKAVNKANDGIKIAKEKAVEHSKALWATLGDLDPRHAGVEGADPLPFFGTASVFQDIMDYGKSHAQKMANTEGIHRILADRATEMPTGPITSREGMDLEKALREVGLSYQERHFDKGVLGDLDPEAFGIDPNDLDAIADEFGVDVITGSTYGRGAADTLARTMQAAGVDVTPDTLKNFMVDRDTVDAIKRIRKFSEGEATAPLVEGWNHVRNLFQSHLTMPFPAFHVRNLTGGFINNVMGGMASPSAKGPMSYVQPYVDAFQLAKGEKIPGIAARMQKSLGNRFAQEFRIPKGVDPDEFVSRQLANEGFDQSVAGGHVLDRLTGEIWGHQAPAPAAMPGTPGHIDMPTPMALGRAKDRLTKLENWNPLDPENFGLIQEGKSTHQTVEYANRMAMYIAKREQGYIPSAAADAVRKTQFDYSELTDFERKRLAPFTLFYTWTRKNLPFQFEQLMAQPRMQATAIRAGTSAGENDWRPSWLSSGFTMPVGGIDPTTGRMPFLTGLGTPIEDAFRMGQFNPSGTLALRDTLSEIGGMLNPAIKGTAELAFGRQLYTGRDLTDLDPYMGISTGSKHADVLINQALSNNPFSRYLGTAQMMLSPYRTVPQKVLQGTTGVRFSTPDVAKSMAKEAEEAVRDRLIDSGGREYSRMFLPEEVRAQASPETMALYQDYQDIQRLQREAVERRKRQPIPR